MSQNSRTFPQRLAEPSSECEQLLRRAADPSGQSAERQEALQQLVLRCRDARVLQSLGWAASNDRDDAAVRSAIVRSLGEWEPNFFPLRVIVPLLSVPAVRRGAIDALDRIGKVDSAHEARLVSELASLRNDTAPFSHALGLPTLYGRDPRVLEFFHEQTGSPSEWKRSVAVSVLLGLGDVNDALKAADDPSARVRGSLAASIGWYRESRGLAIAEQLARDSDPVVALKANRALSALAGSATPKAPALPWLPVLKELSAMRLANRALAAKWQGDWLGLSGASEAQIQTLEQRIGKRLPPSYRKFLSASNGFHHPSNFIYRLQSADQVAWFGEKNEQWAKAYEQMYPRLGSCLQISEVGDAAVVLLNPEVTNADGEWQTLFFANWIPGARPYESFRSYMEDQVDSACEWRNR